jgi:hypothetical protein
MFTEQAGGLVRISQVFFLHSMVMPALGTAEYQGRPGRPNLSIQRSSPWPATNTGRAGVVVWIALILLGAWALVASKGNERFRLALGLLLAGQWLLHVAYGEETFLFALHFLPLLLLLPALSTLTAARPFALGAAAILLVAASINNTLRFEEAVAFIANFPSPI